MHYDGITQHLKYLEQEFLEAMDDELGHKLSMEIFHPMCNLSNHLENLEFEIRNTKQLIENRLKLGTWSDKPKISIPKETMMDTALQDLDRALQGVRLENALILKIEQELHRIQDRIKQVRAIQPQLGGELHANHGKQYPEFLAIGLFEVSDGHARQSFESFLCA